MNEDDKIKDLPARKRPEPNVPEPIAEMARYLTRIQNGDKPDIDEYIRIVDQVAQMYEVRDRKSVV